ncbi:CoA ester lyase [Verrucomicrobia bacterium]|nr:CoA ester lyase [Verrucomicrobiota bacterium]
MTYQSYSSDYSLRSALFVPGYLTKFLEKAKNYDVDALILDLEDSVPKYVKEQARENIKQYLKENSYHQRIYIRVNPIDSGLFTEDLNACLEFGIEGLMPTKIRNRKDIEFIDKFVCEFERSKKIKKNSIKLLPLIETGAAILSAHEIATCSERMSGLALGGEDYLTDLDGLHKEHGTSLIVPRSIVVIAARSAGIEVLDTPFLDIHDHDRYRKELEQSRELGFSGQLIIHPNQIELANKIFTPDESEINEARIIIEAIHQSSKEGNGTTLLNGKLVGPPMLKRAENVIRKIKSIVATEERKPNFKSDLQKYIQS